MCLQRCPGRLSAFKKKKDGNSLAPVHIGLEFPGSLVRNQDILSQNQKPVVQEWCICGVMCLTVNTDKPAVYSAVTVGWEFTDVNEKSEGGFSVASSSSEATMGHIEEVWTKVDIQSTGSDNSPQLSGLGTLFQPVVSYSWQLNCPQVEVLLKEQVPPIMWKCNHCLLRFIVVHIHISGVSQKKSKTKHSRTCGILPNNFSEWGLVLKGKQKITIWT